MAPSSSTPSRLQMPLQAVLQMARALFSLQRESAGARLLARTVLATWLLPMFFALAASFAAPAAQAQGGPVQTVVVLDFAVSGGLDPLYGRKAADGLAVELQRSGQYDVIPRQRVEEAVDQQAGLQPPFNDIAQIKLAQTVNASSVFSGRVERVDVVPGRSARVTLEARQLDVLTGDYINGTVVTETTEQKLGDVASEILVDEAINKAVFSAVRSMRQITLPTGTVLNTERSSVELDIGANRGAVVGQRYTVLRDIYDRARNVTLRQKIGEVKIIRVSSDQSTAELSAGGQQGVQTGDRVRQIFEPGRYPVTSLRNDTSTTPVTAPVTRTGNGGGIFKKSSAGLFGLLALGALVGLAGFGGNDGSGSVPSANSITEANPTQTFPQPRISFDAGFSGINFAQNIDRESVVAYLIYRGTAPEFTPDVSNLQSIIDARFDASSKNLVFVDSGVSGTAPRRQFTFTSATVPQTGTSTVNLLITDANTTEGDVIDSSQDTLRIQFTQRPLTVGQTYYYRVGRITAVRSTTTSSTTTSGVTTVTLQPVRSRVSNATGGYTPLFLPQIVATSGNTDNFSVRVNTDFTQYSNAGGGSFVQDANGNTIFVGDFSSTFGYSLPNNFNVGSGVNQFRFLVSTTPSFTPSATFVSPDIPNPGPIGGTGSDVVLDLGNAGNIRIPSSNSNPYVPGVTPLYVRVLSRNTNDANPTFRVSPTFTIRGATGIDRTATSSRFLDAPGGGAGQGVNLGASGNGSRTSGGGSANPRVLAPR